VIIPTHKKPSPGVSNHWKNRAKSFQWLEKRLKIFPMVGKNTKKSSNDWKVCVFFLGIKFSIYLKITGFRLAHPSRHSRVSYD